MEKNQSNFGDVDLEKINKINISLEKIKNKENKFLFCVPEAQNPVASVYEIYFHATVVKEMGYNVIILTENKEYTIPNWIEKELTEFDHLSMSDPKIMVSPEDIMIIPEVFSNVMEQTKNLPCFRIGLLQSIDYMLNALIPGSSWSDFNINSVITTSDSLKELFETYYGLNKYDIKTYNIGIPEYFNKSTIPQKPIISVVGRNANEISKFVKLFFSRFPQYSWVTFDPMLTKSKPPQAMRRIDFAKRLQNNFAAVWIDRIASFGTFPLECMKSGVIPIGLKPDIMPEYMVVRDENGVIVGVQEAGLWTDNYYDLPIILGDILVKFLDDSIPDEEYSKMDAVVSKFTQENSEKELIKIYNEFIDSRIKLLSNAINEK